MKYTFKINYNPANQADEISAQRLDTFHDAAVEARRYVEICYENKFPVPWTHVIEIDA